MLRNYEEIGVANAQSDYLVMFYFVNGKRTWLLVSKVS